MEKGDTGHKVWANGECQVLNNAHSRRLELGTNCVSMAVDERSIVCGLEDGRVDVYSRATVLRFVWEMA